MKWLNLLLIMFFAGQSLAQKGDTLSLLECFKKAKLNSPLMELVANNQKIYRLKEESISTSNLPQLSAYGKAWYQSDAVTVPPLGPGAEGLSIDRFQYNFGAQIDQKIYDGALVNKLSQKELSTMEANNAIVYTSIYQVYQNVSDAYFAILMLQENLKILDRKKQYLNERQKNLESAYQNGMILKSELNKLKAEKLIIDQQKTDLQFTVEYLKQNLTLLLGLEIKSNEFFVQDTFSISDLNITRRPEYESLSSAEKQILTSKELLTNSLSPKIYAYGQAGYSYPGLNFFENESAPYYIVGVRFAWNIYDWQKTKKEKEIADVQIQNLKTRESELDLKFETVGLSKISEIEKLKALIQTDDEIIDLKSSIVKSGTSALENGTISFSDFLLDVNAEIIARIDRNKHTIQLYQNQVELALIKGINIE